MRISSQYIGKKRHAHSPKNSKQKGELHYEEDSSTEGKRQQSKSAQPQQLRIPQVQNGQHTQQVQELQANKQARLQRDAHYNEKKLELIYTHHTD